MSLENNPIKDLEKEKKDYVLKEADRLLNEYSEEIPENLINGMSENLFFKVRTNWFGGCFALLDYSDNFFPSDFNEEWKEFFYTFKKRRENDNDQTRTTKEEIEKANNLLLRAIEYIKKP